MKLFTKVLSFTFLFATWGISSTEGAEHGINWWHLGSEYKDAPAIGWLTITFFIFVYFVARAVRKPLSLYLEVRSKDIRQQIEEGRLAKLESEKKLKLYEEKLKSLDSEIERIRAAFHDQAQAEKAERERLSKELEARILKDAEDSINASYERSKNRLAEEVITKAMALAEATIAAKNRDQVDSFLKGAFLDDLQDTARRINGGVDPISKAALVRNLKTKPKEMHS